jgi:hypothetical protein
VHRELPTPVLHSFAGVHGVTDHWCSIQPSRVLFSLACLLLKEEFQRKGKYQLMAKQYVRDTVLLTGAAYLMEWVEGGVRAVRGGTVCVSNEI